MTGIDIVDGTAIFVPLLNWIVLAFCILIGWMDESSSYGVLLTIFVIMVLAGVITSAGIAGFEKMVDEYRKNRRAEEKQLIDNARAKTHAEIARNQAISRISELVSEAQLSAARLPLILLGADSSLDLAQNEFSDGLYSPFWEAIEDAVRYIHLFEKTLQSITAAKQKYDIDARPYASEVPQFSIGVSIIPDPSATRSRMQAIYRQAQKDPHFAQIYEQRRTNAILIEGFRSLREAMESLGDRIESEIRYLESSTSFRLQDIQSALRASGEQMMSQQSALLEEAKSWRAAAQSANAEMISIIQSNAERAERGASLRQEMLNNIQRRRKPSLI